MNKITRSRRTPPPSRARSNSDWVMIVVGIALIALFMAAGYAGLNGPGRGPRKPQGPVKDPGQVGRLHDGSALTGAYRR